MAQSTSLLSKKRKHAPTDSTNAKSAANKKQKTDHQARRRDARTLSTQTTSKAFQNGALDVSAFVKAREYEIHALEQGIQRSGRANNRRAFQLVPKALRRRTASHNAKRVPKRLRARAKKEMIEDNTPTVNARTRKPTRHMRLRLDTINRLRAAGAREKAARKQRKEKEKKGEVLGDNSKPLQDREIGPLGTTIAAVGNRRPRVKKKPSLATPATPKAKFRKRQVHKSWLPTHVFHSKRAHMTPPSAPLWRFAIPLTPTQKGYRATHRASRERGAIAWDVSYTSTIGLEGTEGGIDIVLKGLGVDVPAGPNKWRSGTQVRTYWTFQRDSSTPIAPATIVWCAQAQSERVDHSSPRMRRKAFVRVHPAAFFQLWEAIVQLASVAKPSVAVEDLRFEIGSIEITGPGSTEALLGALWPVSPDDVAQTWRSLAGLTNPSTLPAGALLGFSIQDPRLRHPPRTIDVMKKQEDLDRLLQRVASWSVDQTQTPPQIFSRAARQSGAKLRSQKSINRRKTLAAPGAYPDPASTDPHIPILLFTSDAPYPLSKQDHTSSWTILAPWRAIQPIWYGILYYPLSTGQQPRFGGLDEQRQLAFECGQAWFPADYPGTQSGWVWEIAERTRRLQEWEKRPKAKRVSWAKVDLGANQKGEIGMGWACDWKYLLDIGSPDNEDTNADREHDPSSNPSKPTGLTQLSPRQASRFLMNMPSESFEFASRALVTVRITLLTRGVPQACARIYRLPLAKADRTLRESWLKLHPRSIAYSNGKSSRPANNANSKDAQPHVLRKSLAQSLLKFAQAGNEDYPECPPKEDLIGFATTGNFNLAEGRGTGVGCVLIQRALDGVSKLGNGDQLCVVRNSGESTGRLAKWEIVL